MKIEEAQKRGLNRKDATHVAQATHGLAARNVKSLKVRYPRDKATPVVVEWIDERGDNNKVVFHANLNQFIHEF